MAIEVELSTPAAVDVELATQDPLDVDLLPLHRLTQHFDFDSSDTTAGYQITRKADGSFDMQAAGSGSGITTIAAASDTAISGLAVDDEFIYNGSAWANYARTAYNVHRHGIAPGNTAAANSAAIATLIAAAGAGETFLFGPGTYQFNAAIIPLYGQRFIGVGVSGTVLDLNSATGWLFDTSVFNVEIANCTLTSSGTTTDGLVRMNTSAHWTNLRNIRCDTNLSGKGIQFNGSVFFCSVTNAHIFNCDVGVDLVGVCNNNTLDNVEIAGTMSTCGLRCSGAPTQFVFKRVTLEPTTSGGTAHLIVSNAEARLDFSDVRIENPLTGSAGYMDITNGARVNFGHSRYLLSVVGNTVGTVDAFNLSQRNRVNEIPDSYVQAWVAPFTTPPSGWSIFAGGSPTLARSTDIPDFAKYGYSMDLTTTADGRLRWQTTAAHILAQLQDGSGNASNGQGFTCRAWLKLVSGTKVQLSGLHDTTWGDLGGDVTTTGEWTQVELDVRMDDGNALTTVEFDMFITGAGQARIYMPELVMDTGFNRSGNFLEELEGALLDGSYVPSIPLGSMVDHDHVTAGQGGALATGAITSGTFADGRIAESNVTQHGPALINDAGVTTNDIWSASKIISRIATDAAALIATHAALTTTHGVSGNLVGTTDIQTLSAKTLTTPTISATGFTNAQHAHTAANSGGTLSTAAIASGTFADGRISASSVNQHLVGMTGVTIEFPADDEEGILLYRAEQAITITEIRGVCIGGTTPSVTINVTQGTDISAAGTVVKTGMAMSSTTTGTAHTSGFTDATVPAGSYIWIDSTAESGGPDALVVTMKYTVD